VPWLFRRPWLAPVLWILLVVLAAPSAFSLSQHFATDGLGVPGSPSAAVNTVLTRHFGDQANPTATLVYYAPHGVTRPAVASAIRRSLTQVSRLTLVLNRRTVGVLTVSRDRQVAWATVVLPNRTIGGQSATDAVAALRRAARVHQAGLTVYVTGLVPVVHTFTAAIDQDLRTAEIFTLPLTLIALVFIFGSLVAPVGPLLAGFGGITLGLAALVPLSHVVQLAPEVEDAAAMIGLGVGIDYALMLVHRYRLERRAGQDPASAAAAAERHAGTAVLVSGSIVAAAFAITLAINQPLLRSLSLGALVAVVCTVAGTLFVVPSFLVGADRWLDWPFGGPDRASRFWQATARRVTRHPWPYLFGALLFLGLLAYPVHNLRLWNPGVDTLPPSSETRVGYDLWLRHTFPGIGGAVLILAYRPGGFWNPAGQAALARLRNRAQSLADVHAVVAPVVPPAALAALPAPPPSLRPLLGDNNRWAELVVYPNTRASSLATMALVRRLRRRMEGVRHLRVLVGGGAAFTVDVVNKITSTLPPLALAVAAVTYLILLGYFRSLVLPAKAVLLNGVSVAAALGLVTAVFQDGVLRPVLALGGTGALAWTTPVLLFTVLFSLSTDYEVFLMSRVLDRHRHGEPDADAIAHAMEETGRIITGAALIMVTVFLAFGLIGLEFMQEIGFGLGLAILLDASVVRLVLVPAIMRILGRANWWPDRPYLSTRS
jgi:uncharacterized membrane protein YdfJ with MMPL/SSD domain